MNITLTGTKVTQDTKYLAFQKNNQVDTILCTVDTDESWQYRIDIKYSQTDCDNKPLYDIIQLNRNGNICSALLTMSMLPFSGKYTMQLRGTNGAQVYHSEIFEAWVKYSIEPGETYNPVPTEFYQIEENISEINAHPPVPDISGFWKIWNIPTHEYEISDIPLPTQSGDKTYTFVQTIAASTWVINHGLNKYPSVSVVDSGNNVVVGDVKYDSLNELTISFSSAFTGQAYLN